MLADFVAVSEALLIWISVLFLPGYLLGWVLDAFDFRRRGLLARVAISTPLAIAVFPILIFHLWRWSLLAVWMMYASCLCGFAAVLFYERHQLFKFRVTGRYRLIFGIVSSWVVVGTVWLVDLQFDKRIYFPSGAFDYTLRTAITASITNTGVPPQNPYFFPGKSFTLHYHYFWYMLCSLVDKLGGPTVTARHAMLAGTVWCGVGLMAVVVLYCRFFRQAAGTENFDKRMLIGISLLCVTGLDIIPILLIAVLGRRLSASVESWNAIVPSWIHAVLWVPHYIAALIACMTGFLVLRHSSGIGSWRRGVVGGATAGLAFASAAGLGIYVAVVFAVFLVLWLTILLLKKNWLEAGALLVSGIVSLAAAAPYLLTLLGGGSGAGSGGSSGFPFEFAVRPFFLAQAIVQASWPDPGWREPFVNALTLPLNYFLELGFFFVVGVAKWRKARRNQGVQDLSDLSGFLMAASSLLVCSFVRSNVISANDLGYRGILIAQFVLLIWAADLSEDLYSVTSSPVRTDMRGAPNEKRTVLVWLIALGVAGSVYEAFMFRSFPLISDYFPIPRYEWLAGDHHLGSRTYALREVYDRLRTELPGRAIVQHNPKAIPGDLFYGLYADRQLVAETQTCGSVLGGDSALCAGVIKPLNDLFEKPEVVPPSGVDPICRDLSIDALVVKDTDKVWAEKTSWVWAKKPDFANDFARVFLCGKAVPKEGQR